MECSEEDGLRLPALNYTFGLLQSLVGGEVLVNCQYLVVLLYKYTIQRLASLVDVFHIVALPRHVVRHAADDVVVLEGLLDHLLPLPPHLQNSLEWVQAVNLASAHVSVGRESQ